MKTNRAVRNVKVNAFITGDEDAIDYNDDDPEDTDLVDEDDDVFEDEDEDEDEDVEIKAYNSDLQEIGADKDEELTVESKMN